ncbi:uncharacterized protein METZ01_LOCUS433507, partial [marine metagenome]
AWFVKAVKHVPDNQVFKETMKQAFNPDQLALVSKDLAQPSGEPANISGMERTPHQLKIQTESEGSQFLVISEVFYPLRWKASIDNEPVETIKVNGIIRGVEVPAGNHVVSFSYDKFTYKTGNTISFVSFAIALGFVAIGYVKRRRQ